MRCNGVYPYHYMNGCQKREGTKPATKNAYYSRLNMKGISDQDHEHAREVRNTSEKKNLGCYHDTYLKADICKYVLRALQVRSSIISHSTWISMGGLMSKNNF